MTVVIKVLGYAIDKPCPHAGQYLEFFDGRLPPDDPRFGGFTDEISQAQRFPTPRDAFSKWKEPLRRGGRIVKRADGKPDRPLTAFSIILEDCA